MSRMIKTGTTLLVRVSNHELYLNWSRTQWIDLHQPSSKSPHDNELVLRCHEEIVD